MVNMTEEERKILIDQLDRSFQMMPNWAKVATKHAMGAPKNNPGTGLPFKSFREVIECASDESLQILWDDFDGDGDLLPAILTQ